METQEIINQVKQENQENDIIMSNQEIREKVQQQMNKSNFPEWLRLHQEDIQEEFRKEYEGSFHINRPDPCEGCPNEKAFFCHCTIGSMVIEA